MQIIFPNFEVSFIVYQRKSFHKWRLSCLGWHFSDVFCSRLVLIYTKELVSLACRILRFKCLFFILSKLISPFYTGFVGFSSMIVLFFCFFYCFFLISHVLHSLLFVRCLFFIFLLFWSLHTRKIMIYFNCLYANGNIIGLNVSLAVLHVVY